MGLLMQSLIPWLPLSTEQSEPLGEQEHRESNAAGLKWKPAGETLAVLCGFMQREGWVYFCVC